MSRILWVSLQNDPAVKPWALKALGHVCVSLFAGTPGTYLWCVALNVVRLPEPRVCDVMGRTSPSIVPVVKDQPFQAVCEDIQPVGEAGHSILWYHQFRTKHQMPWLRKAKDSFGHRLFVSHFFIFKQKKKSLASFTVQPTQCCKRT